MSTLRCKEDREGTYLSSANRLTRIEVRLTLTRSGSADADLSDDADGAQPCAAAETAGVRVEPVATAGEQSAEIEKLLYDDAREQIDEMIASPV